MKLKKLIKKLIKRIARSKPVMRLLSGAMYYYSRFVGKTTKWQIKGVDEFYRAWKKHKSVILIGWHGRAMMYPFFWNGEDPLNALVSLHQDGRLIAGFLEKYGLGTIGGSSSTNAVGSARDLMESLENDISICVIPDGPKGPNLRLSKSPLYFARKSGKPIFCITYSIKGSKIIRKSWDQMMVPVPFSRGICEVIGPFFIPESADEQELENLRQKIENSMNKQLREVDDKMGIAPIIPGTTAKAKRYINSQQGNKH